MWTSPGAGGHYSGILSDGSCSSLAAGWIIATASAD
jgi:hypothetical protein